MKHIASVLLGSLALCGCAATMKVDVSIADPSGVRAIRQEALSHQVCSSILSQEDAASLDQVRAALGAVAKTCSAARADEAKATNDEVVKSMLESEARAIETIADELDPLARNLDQSRQALAQLLLEKPTGSADPCDQSGRHGAELMRHQDRRKQSVDVAQDVLSDLEEQCGVVPQVQRQLQTAATAVSNHQSLIGGGSLSRSDYAYAVSKLGPERWRHFNQAKGDAHGGNLDLAIKMNEPGDFTVKGMRFDASKAAEVVGKSFVQLLLLSAGHVGQAVSTSSAQPATALAAHNAMAAEQGKQVQREAMTAAYRASATEIALMLIAESSALNGSQDERTQAIAAIKSNVSSSKARLDLSALP